MRSLKTLILAITALMFSNAAFAQLKVIADGKVGIGTSTPARSLEVVGGVLITNLNTTNTNKQSNLLMRHFDNGAVFFNYMTASSNATTNQLLLGGGSGAQYAASAVAFMTAANNATLLGTERMRINNLGQVRFNTAGGSGAFASGVNLALITGDASKPGGGVWATASDSRIKKGVRPFTDGLDKVMEINPVFFSYKENTGYESDKEYVGIIAQEMQKVAPYTITEVDIKYEEDETRLDIPEKLLTYNGTAVTYMLVNAIQEQQAMIEERDHKIEDLEARMEKLEKMLISSTTTTINGGTAVTNVTLEGADMATLKQNAPNPFSENTTIEYTLPKNNFNSAYIQISNVQGAVMRIINLPKEQGPGILNIKAKELSAGEYAYSLIIDGRVIDTKKMLLID